MRLLPSLIFYLLQLPMASVKVEFQGTWYDAVVVGKVPAGSKVKCAEDKFTTIVAVEDAK